MEMLRGVIFIWWKQYLVVLMLIGLAYVTTSCSEDVDSTKGFEVTSLQREESDSTYHMKIYLGKVSSVTTVTLNVLGTAAMDADFSFDIQEVDTNSDIIVISNGSASDLQRKLTAMPGESYVELSFKLIDDNYVEPKNETIYFQITSVSDESIDAALVNREQIFSIYDNDSPPANALQIDLSWAFSSGGSINQDNFDLYLARNVVLGTNGDVISKELLSQPLSKNETGFESFTIDSNVPDGKYYVVIRFVSGSANADIELILSKNNTYSRASGYISTTYVGRDLIYGPITKSGNTYARMDTESPEFIY